MQILCKSLLKEWCRALLKLQIMDTGNPRLDGAILCPSCGRIHGRCFEAMYPFLCLAKMERDSKWIKAAERLFQWAEHTVSQEDGSYLNDIDSDWVGTTVFSSIQLAECLMFHGDLLDKEIKSEWLKRLERAADFLYGFKELEDNNINYPISNALALYQCGMVLHKPEYFERARNLASIAEQVFTEEGLLFGEGVPRDKKSPKGCYPVDIGYNAEETLPSLALYGSLSGNEVVLSLAEKGLEVQLDFMLENGAWDNSFGTRNFKWTYWGSRTSDGCALGYLLLGDSHPEFVLAAERNLKLMKRCTFDGLLSAGPDYLAAGQPICTHHTFTHAKVLAGILDRELLDGKQAGNLLPREKEGLRYYSSIATWLINLNSATATVTAYDWEYLPGGHVSGGTLSLYHHNKAGTLLCAGMGQYWLKEPNNMQIPYKVRHECLALRIEVNSNHVRYSSIYEDQAQIIQQGNKITVWGEMKDINHKKIMGQDFTYYFCYEFEENMLKIKAKFLDGVLICPLISQESEEINIGDKEVGIIKGNQKVMIRTNGDMKLPYGKERIFNLIPGLQGVRVDIFPLAGEVELVLEVM